MSLGLRLPWHLRERCCKTLLWWYLEQLGRWSGEADAISYMSLNHVQARGAHEISNLGLDDIVQQNDWRAAGLFPCSAPGD